MRELAAEHAYFQFRFFSMRQDTRSAPDLLKCFFPKTKPEYCPVAPVRRRNQDVQCGFLCRAFQEYCEEEGNRTEFGFVS